MFGRNGCHKRRRENIMNYLLGIDVGTSATKTVLFDEKGTVIASASQEYPLSAGKWLGRAETRGLERCSS